MKGEKEKRYDTPFRERGEEESSHPYKAGHDREKGKIEEKGKEDGFNKSPSFVL